MEKRKRKKWKKNAAVGMVAAAASASVLVGGAFDSPADLLTTDGDGDEDSPAPVVETLNAQVPELMDDGGDGGDGDEEERRQRFPAVRRWVSGLPLGVRALVGVPLWCVGWGITTLLSLLWQAALTPLGGRILSWVLTAAAAVLVFALSAKALFPHVPWRKLLRPRNILLVTIGIALLGTADTLLSAFWKDYPPIGQALRLLGGAVMIALACFSSRKLLEKKELAEPGTELEAGSPSPRTEIELQAMSLADSVCAPSPPRS
ncbi:MAG: hypothetical protein E7426_05320 [Ruminococcaceae bacterium]|nr:hypothetical protein [Oscillospiraceae bacterium]